MDSKIMEITYTPSTYDFPNLIVENKYIDGEHRGWRVTPTEGYVFYDLTDEVITELDPETGEEVSVIYYYTLAYLPRNYNFEEFQVVAVPRDSVDENYIFGGGSNTNTEVM